MYGELKILICGPNIMDKQTRKQAYDKVENWINEQLPECILMREDSVPYELSINERSRIVNTMVTACNMIYCFGEYNTNPISNSARAKAMTMPKIAKCIDSTIMDFVTPIQRQNIYNILMCKDNIPNTIKLSKK